jgi:hypothetical protein
MVETIALVRGLESPDKQLEMRDHDRGDNAPELATSNNVTTSSDASGPNADA